MNAIGEFGEFVIDYQNQIQFSLVILFAVLLIIFIIRAAVHAKKKRELLSQINDTVSEISTTVNSISEKKQEVIYIDNRVPPVSICPVTENAVKPEAEGTISKPENIERSEESDEPDNPVNQETEDSGVEKEKDVPRMGIDKFFDRDCAVSKNGREYSIEELENQIKE